MAAAAIPQALDVIINFIASIKQWNKTSPLNILPIYEIRKEQTATF